jgi:trimethylamine monooxygenase
MSEDASFRTGESNIKNPFNAIEFQGGYLKDLLSLTSHPPMNIDGINATFFEWVNHKVADVMTFRHQNHKSLVTGNAAPVSA